jgi:hypothetical protein
MLQGPWLIGTLLCWQVSGASPLSLEEVLRATRRREFYSHNARIQDRSTGA